MRSNSMYSNNLSVFHLSEMVFIRHVLQCFILSRFSWITKYTVPISNILPTFKSIDQLKKSLSRSHKVLFLFSVAHDLCV